MTQRCIACHEEIAWYRVHGRGFHARVMKTECAGCHPDHAGREFDMVKWDEGSAEKFRHDRTGWPLAGAHAKVACRSCHKLDSQRLPIAAKIRKRDRGASWLGLDTACASCHADPHKGRFGADCATCHTVVNWKEIPEKGFDHDRTRYPLRGRHVSVACAACHDPKTAFGPKPAFAACGDCHKDAHAGTATIAGRFADCAACHNVSGFQTSIFTVARHAKSDYPLTGKHEAVKCGACHTRAEAGAAAKGLGTARVRMRPGFDRCERCHEDAHGGQIVAAVRGAKAPAARAASARGANGGRAARAASAGGARTACADCHTTAAFRPSTYRVSDHAALRLKLEGAHATTACRDCHAVDRAGLPWPEGRERAGRAGFVFRITELECAACHADPHAGRFAEKGARPDPLGCLGCHTPAAFRPAVYDVARHAHSRYPLEGAHAATPCGLCHKELRSAPARSTLARAAVRPGPLLFRQEKRACVDCHEDVHGGQFRSRKLGSECESCHGLDAFAPAARFDHDRDASFHLAGAHAKVPCERCHRTERDRSGKKRVVYRGVPSRCEDCHAT
jgi:hypothetical protein